MCKSLKFYDWSGAKVCESYRSRKMLKNASFLAIVAVHTAENEPFQNKYQLYFYFLFRTQGLYRGASPAIVMQVLRNAAPKGVH